MTLGKDKMKTISTPGKMTVSVLAMTMMAISHQAIAAEITGLTSTQTGVNTSELRFSFDGTPVKPKGFYYEKDHNLILDFKSVSSSLPRQVPSVQSGLINSASAVESDGNTRVVLGLKPESKYTYRVEGNDLVLKLTNQSMQSPSSVPVVTESSPIVENSYQPASYQSSPAVVTSASESDMEVRVNPLLTTNINSSYMNSESSYDGLSSVNFSGNGNGGNISIGLNNEAIPVDVSRQGNKIVMRMTGSTIPSHLLRRMNVNSSLVSSIDASNSGSSGMVTINMNGDFEYQAYQSGRQLNISVMPPKVLTEPSLEEKTYSGEPLSMEFQDVPVRNVLDILAQFTEMNIVASDSVSGNVTLRLMNVPWDQALDIIMSSKGLDKRENGNVIWVAPAEEIAKYETDKRQAVIDAQALDPLRTEYIRLSYADAKNVETLISKGNSGSGKEKESSSNSLLSGRGTVTIDERTNTLIVKDTSASIENIRALISKIDIPVKQVQIEARIVSATDSFSKDIGVEWGILSNGVVNNDTLLVGGSTQTLWDLKQFDINTATVNGQEVSYPSYDISRPDNLNVSLGAANPAGKIAFSLLTMSDLMLDLELSAMQADNKGEVISSPKVLAMDKQTAKISSGTQIPYESVSDKGTETQFEEAALSLEVTPNITPDGKIGLALNITNGNPTIINKQIAISEDSISTNVLVEDGQTVVLGGVFKNTVTNGVRKVPFLGDLPYIGRAFRNDTRTNNKNELLIFITTRIVNDGVSNF